MRSLNRIILSLAFIGLLSSCFSLRDETIRVKARREPMADLSRKTVVVFPPIVYSRDLQLNRDLGQYLVDLLNENAFNAEMTVPTGVSDSLLMKASQRFLHGEEPDTGLLHNMLAHYILSVKLDLLYDYFSAYSGDDGLSPAYSVEHGGAPGLFEQHSHWKERSFQDIVFRMKARFLLYDIEKGKVVIDKTEEYQVILEDFRQKSASSVSAEGDRAYIVMTQSASEDFLSWCRERDVLLERTYLR